MVTLSRIHRSSFKLSISAKGATIMIQPSNPVYGAKNYPKSIEALKQFAAQNNYTYIDYWGVA